jgi:hypothetical protein
VVAAPQLPGDVQAPVEVVDAGTGNPGSGGIKDVGAPVGDIDVDQDFDLGQNGNAYGHDKDKANGEAVGHDKDDGLLGEVVEDVVDLLGGFRNPGKK